MTSVLHINTRSDDGGAAQAALLLHHSLNRLSNISSTYLTGRGIAVPGENIVGLGVRPWKLYANVLAYRLLGVDGPLNQKHWKAVEPLIEAADIIHLHNAHGYYMPYSVLERILEKPVVWTLHDFWLATGRLGNLRSTFSEQSWMEYLWPWGGYGYPVELFDRSKSKAARMMKLLRWKRPVLVAPTRTMKDRLTSMGVPCLEVIYHGIFSDLALPTGRVELRRRLRWPASKRILLFVATSIDNPVKGWPVLERATYKLRRPDQWQLIIIGNDRNGIIRNLSYPVHTTLLGSLKRDEIMTYFRAADLYVNPTMEESFGLTNLEALGEGTDVLCSDLPVLREIAGQTATFFPPGSSDALAAALNSYEPADEAARIERAGLVRKRFKMQQMTESYRVLYETVLSNRYSSASTL